MIKQPIPIFQVDAFTEKSFSGNPAAVCLAPEGVSEAWMQALAAEMNLAETAYVVARDDGEFGLRWFTPEIEVPLCGHATLASAHILWETGKVPREQAITFNTHSGKLTAHVEASFIRLEFPVLPVESCDVPGDLSAALGLDAPAAYCNTNGVGLVELASEQAVRDVAPDFAKLRATSFSKCIVTARGERDGCDFVSRFFAPGAGIDEDPVTGSAHCSLTPYWAQRLGKSEMIGHQLSKRGGTVRVRLRGERVDLLGQAVTIFCGELTGSVADTCHCS